MELRTLLNDTVGDLYEDARERVRSALPDAVEREDVE